MDDVPAWAQLVKQRRSELRLSIRAAARRADVSESLWRQMESKGHRPKPENLASMSLALGWSADQGLSHVIDGLEPVEASPSDSTPILNLTTLPNLEARVATLEDQLRSVMAVVLQIQHERQQDELRGSPARAEAKRSER